MTPRSGDLEPTDEEEESTDRERDEMCEWGEGDRDETGERRAKFMSGGIRGGPGGGGGEKKGEGGRDTGVKTGESGGAAGGRRLGWRRGGEPRGGRESND